MDRRTEALALCATFLTAIMLVLVFFPAEGLVLAPIHTAINTLFGQTTFVLPLGLTLLSALLTEFSTIADFSEIVTSGEQK